MNERIRELAEQSNAWYPDGYPSGEGGDAAWKDLVIFSKQDLGKFAELIIKDCISMADEFELDVNKSGLVDRIKYHFGIEFTQK